MREPSFCKGCIYSKVYPHSGGECDRSEYNQKQCVEGSEYVSKADGKLNCEERRES